MSFKFYKNKITGHPSVSLRQKDRRKWYNMPVSHQKPKDSYLEINDPHPKAKESQKSFVRKYIRKDKRGVKGHPYKEYRLTNESEIKIKKYIVNKHKKR